MNSETWPINCSRILYPVFPLFRFLYFIQKYIHRPGFRDRHSEGVLKINGRTVPIEVKSGHYNIKEVAKAFNRIGQNSGILITQDSYDMVQTGNTKIFLCPIEFFAMYPDELLNQFLLE